MGRLFFGVDIQSEIANVIGPGDLPAFFLKKGVNSYETRGSAGQYDASQMDKDKSIVKGDQRVSIVAQPLDAAGVEPTTGDVIVDDTGKTMTVIKAHTNSARAMFICHCRG